jgi:hypothetical protein
MERTIPDPTWAPLAQSLNVEAAALRAVAAVESAGSGFLPEPSPLPKVLFEGHAFHRLTQGRFDASHPTLSYPKWTKQFYSKTGAGEWDRLNAACALDRTAALQSASWGMFQIMGFNYGIGEAASSTARRPLASAARSRSAWTAGMAAVPGRAMPSASAIEAMVEAVPITAQVPAVVARLPSMVSIPAASTLPARCIAQKRRQSVHAPRRSPW